MASRITELKSTVFVTPIISHFFRGLSRLVIRLIGWRLVGETPTEKKYLIIGAPHTSNWDFVLYVMFAFIRRFDFHWMGKSSLFFFPFKRLMIWLGGIPIDRSKANNVIDQMVAYYRSVDQLVVIITPEGTRSKVRQWKTGFYHIARQAELPVYLGYIDCATKTMGFGKRFEVSSDIDADIKAIQAFYADKQGINPDNV